ncbi:LacI family DNA-binding transcriptional regulator [Paenibacillus aurantius]|uniref:LacI family DNA-binding transcriptional regulator n=1 Tax=Paenibacillus aurantius TaxID=2918900 RepID=A0AA96RGS9_9BACL|nr:LacI family DNA-binding transcriptional regulator [Paenibacillus aurantius]WNQ13362.1 LacI family DNA-binding transcriptional regulator [Paenibacillus aurantius]
MPKLKDIAEHVGVSISTVSRVINNDSSRHINQETKTRVWKAVEELGYETAGLGKKQNRKNERNSGREGLQIGCIVSAPQNKYNHPYFSPILEGIERKLTEQNSSLAYVLTLEEIQGESALGRLLQETRLDGIIIIEGIPSTLYEKIKKSVPAVVGIDISDSTVPVITYDRVQAAKTAVRHLIAEGHERIAFIGGNGLTGEMEREKRYRGYRYAMEEAGLAVDPEWILNTGWDVNESYRLMAERLGKAGPERPTAVFAASDMLAISAMRAAAEQGLRIPEDMAFVGHDNIEVSQFTMPPLSTVHVPKYEIGMMAAKVLIDQCAERSPLPFKLVMPFEMILRPSSVRTPDS